MDLYLELLSGLVTTILGRFTYIGSNITDFPLILYIIGVSVVLETVLLLKTLMKGE